MLNFIPLPSEVNSTLLNDTLQKTADAPAPHPGDYVSSVEQDTSPYLNRGVTVFFFVTALTVIGVGLVLVLKFVRHYHDNKCAAREEQLRTVTWMEGDCEEDEVQALVAE